MKRRTIIVPITYPICSARGYVTKYFNVKNRAFLPNFMRDFDHLYAKLLSGYQSRNNRCENRAFY